MSVQNEHDGSSPKNSSNSRPDRRAGDKASQNLGPAGRRDVLRAEGGVIDPRMGLDRRAMRDANPVASEAGATDALRDLTGLERRRGAGRRRSDFTRSAEEGELTSEQFLFVKAIDEFKKANNKMFPSWTDVLEVIRLLGYRKTMASELSIRAAEDWKEKPDTPANVRPMGWERRFNDAEREAA